MNNNNETLGMDLLEELGKATLISTTNFQFKGYEGRKGRVMLEWESSKVTFRTKNTERQQE